MVMKKICFISIFILFFTNYSCAFDSESLNLDTEEIHTLKVPNFSPISRTIDNEDVYINKKQEERSNYFDIDEEVFENKSGQTFSKFINEKVINNKITNFSSKIEERIHE